MVVQWVWPACGAAAFLGSLPVRVREVMGASAWLPGFQLSVQEDGETHPDP